jgi:hypothetical protein
MKRLIAIGVLSAVFGASCSGGESAAPPTSASVVTTDASSTTVAATVPPTSSTAAATTTTLPATTTTIATEVLIKQAVQDYITAYFTCGQVPAQCDPATFTASQGPSRATVTELIAGMVKEGLYFSTDVRGSHLNPTSVEFGSLTEATVQSCWYDAGIVLGPVGPDGQATIVNDEAGSSRYSHTLYFEDGLWRVAQQSELESLGDGDLCGATS